MDLTEFLTNIASAIRSKEGTDTIIPAKDFAKRIRSIPSSASYSKVNTGHFIVSENTDIIKTDSIDNSFPIKHGLGSGVYPNFALVFDIDYFEADSYPPLSNVLVSMVDFGVETYNSVINFITSDETGSNTIKVLNNTQYSGIRYDDTNYRLMSPSSTILIPGRTYKWIVGRV